MKRETFKEKKRMVVGMAIQVVEFSSGGKGGDKIRKIFA
jgi:hypothetical protein